MVAALIKVLAHNIKGWRVRPCRMGAACHVIAQDRSVHALCVAALSNLSFHMSSLHAAVCTRFVALLALLHRQRARHAQAGAGTDDSRLAVRRSSRARRSRAAGGGAGRSAAGPSGRAWHVSDTQAGMLDAMRR